MDVKILIDKIIGDAKAEAKKIVGDATTNAKENIAYAARHRDELIKAAKEQGKLAETRAQKISASEQELANRLELLRLKTEIFESVFNDAMKKVDYKFRVETKPNYEHRLTREELGAALRFEIEAQIVRILFG